MAVQFSIENAEKQLHVQAVEDLSGWYGLPVHEVWSVYERELAFLAHDARVRSYLPILVRRRMKKLLDR